jgi:hypothetical protein
VFKERILFMGTVISIIIVLLIVAYATHVIMKYIRQVRAGKCLSCNVKKGEDCHCHRVDDIMGYGEETRHDKKN